MRIEDKNINVLHVLANESFAEFAETLQREIELETSIKFGVFQLSLFQGMIYEEKIVQEKTVSYEEAAELMAHFESKDYITKRGKMKDTMKNALLSGTLDLPQKFEAARNHPCRSTSAVA